MPIKRAKNLLYDPRKAEEYGVCMTSSAGQAVCGMHMS